MTTNIKPGQKIRIAVPITPGDDSPFSKRREFRTSTVETVGDNGVIGETEGTVRADRIGIDWEICEPEAEQSEGKLIVVAMKGGPVLASVIRVKGKLVEAYSDQAVPPGPLMLPASGCGKVWDWLKGRTVGQAFMNLSEVFEPNQDRQPAGPGQAEPAAAAPPEKKKRGPKPRAMVVTATTEVLPVVTAPTVAAADRKVSFRERMRIWHKVSCLAGLLEQQEPDGRICQAMGDLSELIREFKAGGDVR